MGNEKSRLKGLVIDKNAVEANDFWGLYNAESPTTSNEDERQLLSVFQGEPVVNGQLWIAQGPIERAIRNLKIYRHPYILRYVTTWEQGGQKHLATERVRPLVSILSTQSDIQICLGLRTVLCSLIFLVEKALARHLNICTSAIYVTDSDSWHLFGFEYVWKQKEVNKTLLDFANAYRYKPAIDPREFQHQHSDTIEQYAFANLCEELLAKCSSKDSTIPHIEEFREYCRTYLKHKSVELRPKLSAVLLHPYFNHEFVLIHSFMFELPLKGLQEKQDFFTGLIDRLRYFNEEMVGTHLARDLLSRMVLLDPTAQLCVTPYVLRTKSDMSVALFSHQTYRCYLVPQIKKMFRLRDAQIRLILLEYFMEYVRLLDEDELREFFMPHLIAGMNDTNDVLVAKTLRCLADLVPILGVATVLGGERSRLFSDGRPQAALHDCDVPTSTMTTKGTHWVEPRSITPVLGDGSDYMVSGSPLPNNCDLSGSFNSIAAEESIDPHFRMLRRLSPDGGEAADESVNTTDNAIALTILGVDQQTEISNKTCQELDGRSGEAHSKLNGSRNAVNNNTHSNYDDIGEEEPWSDWEADELQRLNYNNELCDTKPETSLFTEAGGTIQNSSASYSTTSQSPLKIDDTANSMHLEKLPASKISTPTASTISQVLRKKINDDLSALDINVQSISYTINGSGSNEFDFFKDMEPVIKASCSQTRTTADIVDSLTDHNIKKESLDEEIKIDVSRFAALSVASHSIDVGADDASPASKNYSGDGWGVDDETLEVGSWSG